MPKSLTGSVKFDAARNRWCARINPTDPDTGRTRPVRRYAKTKVEAQAALRQLLRQYDERPASLHTTPLTFAELAARYRKQRLIPARYAGERKIAGMRGAAVAKSLLKLAEAYFGTRKLSTIKRTDLEEYRLHLADTPTRFGAARSLGALNRPLSLLRAVLNFAVENGWLHVNPFAQRGAVRLIDAAGEPPRDRIPTFGEELALLAQCVGRAAYLRGLIILAADTGLRRNELLTLEVNDLDFERRVIRLRAINAKSNHARIVPMTARAEAELRAVVDAWTDGPLFGVRHFVRTWDRARRATGVQNLHWHDWRHAFLSRAILAGVPLAAALQASGHSHAAGEWQRYSNLDSATVKSLLKPYGNQSELEIKAFARDVLHGLRDATAPRPSQATKNLCQPSLAYYRALCQSVSACPLRQAGV